MEMRRILGATAVLVAIIVGTTSGYSQSWSIGGKMGLSSLDGSAGFHITPMAEIMFDRNMGAGTEFSLNTQYGEPLMWYTYFKYSFDIPGSRLRPFANAGPVLTLNVPNDPCFGFLVGGGINIPIAPRISIVPDILLGPVYDVGGGTYNLFLYGNYYGTGAYSASSYDVPGTTIFVFSIRGGIRYEL